jgi:hypothetical protein
MESGVKSIIHRSLSCRWIRPVVLRMQEAQQYASLEANRKASSHARVTIGRSSHEGLLQRWGTGGLCQRQFSPNFTLSRLPLQHAEALDS